MTATQSRTGAQVLVDQLRIHGVDLAFCVPGESFLAVLDALYDVREEIRLITCRHEAGAANMAEAYGKLTGHPGICLVTRGPGASHASVALHTAFQDSTPLILFVGQVQRDALGREAFQEVDCRHFFSEMSKWVCEIHDAARIPELLSHAFHVATTGRPGPVVLALPQDMLVDTCEVADACLYQVPQSAPTAENVERITELLRASRKPLVVVGGSRWSEQVRAHTEAFASQWNLPVITAFRCQDHFDNYHPNYAGELGISCNPQLAARVKAADLLLVLGARLGEATTNGYTLVDIPIPRQTLIHAHSGAEELGRVYQGDLLINSAMAPLTQALASLPPPETVSWSDWTEAARDDYLMYLEPFPVSGDLNFGEVLTHLRETIPDAIVTNGAGNHTAWGHRFWRFRSFPSQLGPTSGAMAYGFPAGVAAKLAHPEREVVCLTGDGCFLMAGAELATAVQYGVNLLTLLVNNSMYGTIRVHQERDYPGRVHGTGIENPDFAAYARAFGAHGEQIRRTEDFPEALQRARAANQPALIELVMDPDATSMKGPLSQIRQNAPD
ncbi:MAG: thiamine pyrophosphate-binding protein [SAR324 cluster bacterium]|jgi:acetolactate synthase-1/2/3 large subunit|nr:thiamine pyrophosphate-binding protein [SAR324 cluster bacterium]